MLRPKPDGHYRKKPVVIEAVQWQGRTVVCPPGPAWFAEAEASGVIRLHGDLLSIRTTEGEMTASVGDWIIRGIKHELYPCKPDVFAETYAQVEYVACPDCEQQEDVLTGCPTCGALGWVEA